MHSEAISGRRSLYLRSLRTMGIDDGRRSQKESIRQINSSADVRGLDPPPRKIGRVDYFANLYNLHGLVRVASQVPLRELAHFRVPSLDDEPDISVRLGAVGRTAPRTTATIARYTHPPAVRYLEHLGRLGANFRVEFGQPIQVTVGPLLAASPHVLYTNLVEALLRFIFVTRGHVLLHSACLEIKDSGVLISARTDTGKTGTILRLLREHAARFLSDDMTILAPSGVAISYPKPLTISHHTLRAVNIDELSRREGRRLRIQSRVHSREGRRLGMMVGRLNLPIMSINAITQVIVSPPKYPVDRLVSCRIVEQSTVRDIVFISSGSPTIASVPHEIALGQLIENTDDAYGFPPFRQFAPALVLGGHDYAELRRMEHQILAAALTRMRVHRVTSNNFSWADEIPHVIGAVS